MCSAERKCHHVQLFLLLSARAIRAITSSPWHSIVLICNNYAVHVYTYMYVYVQYMYLYVYVHIIICRVKFFLCLQFCENVGHVFVDSLPLFRLPEVSFSPSLPPSLSLCLSVSICLCVCLSLSLSLSLSVSLSCSRIHMHTCIFSHSLDWWTFPRWMFSFSLTVFLLLLCHSLLRQDMIRLLATIHLYSPSGHRLYMYVGRIWCY